MHSLTFHSAWLIFSLASKANLQPRYSSFPSFLWTVQLSSTTGSIRSTLDKQVPLTAMIDASWPLGNSTSPANSLCILHAFAWTITFWDNRRVFATCLFGALCGHLHTKHFLNPKVPFIMFYDKLFPEGSIGGEVTFFPLLFAHCNMAECFYCWFITALIVLYFC